MAVLLCPPLRGSTHLHIESLGKFVVWNTVKFCWTQCYSFFNLMGSPSSPLTSHLGNTALPHWLRDTCYFSGEEALTLATCPISHVSITVCCTYICDTHCMQFLLQRAGSVIPRQSPSYKPQSEGPGKHYRKRDEP